jgi:hypothetical protein
MLIKRKAFPILPTCIKTTASTQLFVCVFNLSFYRCAKLLNSVMMPKQIIYRFGDVLLFSIFSYIWHLDYVGFSSSLPDNYRQLSGG